MADIANQDLQEQPQASEIEAYATFPFETDEEFQQGLGSLIAGGALEGKSDDEKAEVLRLARVFFFNRRTGSNLSVEIIRDYERGISSQPASASDNQQSKEPRVLSFAELQELIQSGRVDEIPNNKVIPNILNGESPSESTAQTRKKPWEK